MTNSTSIVFKKYSVPAIFIVFGLVMIITGLASSQDINWYIGSLLVLFAGLISVLYSSGNITKKIALVSSVGAGVVALIAYVMSYTSVTGTIKHTELFTATKTATDQQLIDIRTAQKEFMAKNRRYAHDWNELEDFIKNSTVSQLVSVGVVPDSAITIQERAVLYGDNRPINGFMTEQEALRLSKMVKHRPSLDGFRRDTIQIPVYQKLFGNRPYLEIRERLGLNKFVIDSLEYVPYTRGKSKFKMEALDSIPGFTAEPLLYVWGVYPTPETRGGKLDTVSFGSLTIVGLSGTWEDK